jgi:hypothetical protein
MQALSSESGDFLMVTDPVERIRAFEHETPIALDLKQLLSRLAALPPSPDAPYLTLALDWRPEGSDPARIPPPEPKRSQRRAPSDEDGSSRRPAWQVLQRDLQEAVASYGPRGTAFDSLTADLERITAYLADELDAVAQAVVIIACGHRDIFVPAPLDIPVLSSYTIAPIPSLRPLVQAADDHPAHAVLVADQREAFLWLLRRETWDRAVELESDDYPRKQQQGGWSQRRYQSRADERVEHFAKAIAEETRRELGEGEQQIPYLIVGADEPMFSALDGEFHETVKKRVLGRIHLPMEAGITDIAAEAEPLVAEAERRREMEAVQSVRDGIGVGGMGAAGPADTITALETGQVMTLVMNDDFSRPGWADYTLPLFGVGDVPREHPAGGDVANIVPTALADEVVRLALLSDADIEIVKSEVPVGREEQEHIPDAEEPTPRSAAARALDELGGIGAVFRFSIEEQTSTEENPG